MAARKIKKILKDGDVIKVKPVILDENQPRIYANQISISHTEHDFGLLFIDQVSPPKIEEENGEFYAIAPVRARVVVPVTLIKGFIKALELNLGRYEKQYGEILKIGNVSEETELKLEG